jgi:hypothetical protein
MQNATLNNNASVRSLNPKSVKNATSAHALTIAAYELSFRKGMLNVLGMYSDAIIDHPNFLVLVFLSLTNGKAVQAIDK